MEWHQTQTRSFARFCTTPRVVIQIRIDQLTKKFIFTLFLCRPKSIVGLPPRLSSFGIIFSESVCSANKIAKKERYFWYKTLLLGLFGPLLNLFYAKTPCLVLVSDFFLLIALSGNARMNAFFLRRTTQKAEPW